MLAPSGLGANDPSRSRFHGLLEGTVILDELGRFSGIEPEPVSVGADVELRAVMGRNPDQVVMAIEASHGKGSSNSSKNRTGVNAKGLFLQKVDKAKGSE